MDSNHRPTVYRTVSLANCATAACCLLRFPRVLYERFSGRHTVCFHFPLIMLVSWQPKQPVPVLERRHVPHISWIVVQCPEHPGYRTFWPIISASRFFVLSYSAFEVEGECGVVHWSFAIYCTHIFAAIERADNFRAFIVHRHGLTPDSMIAQITIEIK